MDLPSAVAISAVVIAWRVILISFRSLNSSSLKPAEMKIGIRYATPCQRSGGSGESSVMMIEGEEEMNLQRALYQVGVM